MTARQAARGAAHEVVAALVGRGHTLAVAESLTGGLVADAMVSVPGTSAAFRGGVVAYATDVKRDVLGVPAALLEARGAIDPDVAVAMAEGVRARLDADWGVGTTGVAGPEPQDGAPVGLVFVAVAGPTGPRVQRLELSGDREEIRESAAAEALRLLRSAVGEHVVPVDGGGPRPEHQRAGSR